jgi:PAS domain S-box-containing protein
MLAIDHGSSAKLLAELKESREIFRLLVEGTPDYAIFMLDSQGRVQTWNAGARHLKGYEEAEVIGRHLSLFYPPDDPEKPFRALAAAVETGRCEEEGWRVRKDGSRFWASTILTAVLDGGGRLTGFSKVTRDLTDRRLAEQALRAQADQLERRVVRRTAQLKHTNEQLQAFAYSVSHDLRSPLLGLEGLANALLEDYGDRLDDLGLEYVRTMASTARGLIELTQNLLAYSRLGTGERSLALIDAIPPLEEALASLHGEIVASGGAVSIPRKIPRVVANAPTLVQLFANLVSNALKFRSPERAPEVRVEAEPRGPLVRIWVRDNGIGIAAEFHQRIFKVFERLHGSEHFAGSGIGLAIVATGVRTMGGRVGVESQLGQGASFWFDLHGDISR